MGLPVHHHTLPRLLNNIDGGSRDLISTTDKKKFTPFLLKAIYNQRKNKGETEQEKLNHLWIERREMPCEKNSEALHRDDLGALFRLGINLPSRTKQTFLYD